MKNGKQPTYTGRVGLQQRVLPSYRVPFFDHLAGRCDGGLSLFSGEPRSEEAILSGMKPSVALHEHAHNVHILSGPAYLCAQRGMLRWLDRWDPDVLILEANPRYLTNRRAISWMHARQRPIIGWALGAPPLAGWLSAPRRELRRQYLQRFDAIIAYSSTGASEYGALGIPAERVHTAYNAVAPIPGPLVERAPLPGRPVRILFVGRLQARKRIDLLLHACARQTRLLELTIVGDGPARSRLEDQAAEVFPEARFVGAQQGDALRAYYEWADLFVLPGTGGLAVQEAMSYALPVMVAEGDGTQRDLVRPENGWLLTPDDLEVLTSALHEALSDEERLAQMGLHSHHLAVTQFNIVAMADTFINVMKTLSGEST